MVNRKYLKNARPKTRPPETPDMRRAHRLEKVRQKILRLQIMTKNTPYEDLLIRWTPERQRLARLATGHTFSTLSKLTGTARSIIYHYESGERLPSEAHISALETLWASIHPTDQAAISRQLGGKSRDLMTAPQIVEPFTGRDLQAQRKWWGISVEDFLRSVEADYKTYAKRHNKHLRGGYTPPPPLDPDYYASLEPEIRQLVDLLNQEDDLARAKKSYNRRRTGRPPRNSVVFNMPLVSTVRQWESGALQNTRLADPHHDIIVGFFRALAKGEVNIVAPPAPEDLQEPARTVYEPKLPTPSGPLTPAGVEDQEPSPMETSEPTQTAQAAQDIPTPLDPQPSAGFDPFPKIDLF